MLRRGFSLIELLIVVAILAALVGVAAPFFQDHLREAQRTKTLAQLDIVRKALGEELHTRGLTEPAVPDASGSPLKAHLARNALPLEAILGRRIPERPMDSWGNPIYTFGSYVVSNGLDGVPDPFTLLSVSYLTFSPAMDPETGTVLSSAEGNEAQFHVDFLARQLAAYIDQGNPAPATLSDYFAAVGKAVPPDPWGQPYRLDGNEVVSTGPDATLGTDDDLRTTREFLPTVFDYFEAGMVGWVKLYPNARRGGGTSMPVSFSPDDDEMVFDSRGMTTPSASYWVKLRPASLKDNKFFWLRPRVKIEITSGTALLGLFGGYQGYGTGWRMWMQITKDGVAGMRLQEGVPNLTGKRLNPPDGSLRQLSASAPANLDMRLVLRATDDGGGEALVRVRQLEGPLDNSSLDVDPKPPLSSVPDAGLQGFWVQARSPSDQFVARLYEFEYASE